MAQLVPQHDPDQAVSLGDKTTLGRSSQNTVQVPGKKASRQHAHILRQGGQFLIEDLGSSNGTFVDGRKVKRQVLKHGMVVRITDAEYRFDDESDDPLIGANLRGYKVRRKLGAGGMGTVYLGWQTAMEREVALKVLNPELVKDKEFIEQFESEAKLAGRLNHPNIIGVHDFGFANDCYFFSMEYVDGESLQAVLDREGALPPARCIELGLQIARGLEHAHELGVLHQDIKPLNIMIGAGGEAKIADLGLAQTYAHGQESSSSMGKLVGTPQYMAPEVLRRQPPTVQSDLFSLGTTLFHMAVGRSPLKGSNASEIVRQRLELPTPDPNRFNPDLPRPLAAFIQRLMAKNPEDRPPSAGAAATELTVIQAELDAPTPAKRAPAAKRSVTPALGPPGAPVEEAGGQKPPSRGSARSSTEDGSAGARRRGLASTRTQAKIIMYLISVAIAVAGAALFYFFVLPPPEEREAREVYEEAVSLARGGDVGSALDTLETLLRRYDKTTVAPDARRLKAELEMEREVARIERQHQMGSLSAGRALEQLDALLAQGIKGKLAARLRTLMDAFERKRREEESAGDEDEGESLAVRASRAWPETETAVERMLRQEREEDAAQALKIFMESYTGTPEADLAGQRLAALQNRASDGFEEELERVRTYRANRRPGEAWKLLETLYRQEDGVRQRSALREEMAQIDGAVRQRFFALHREARTRFAELRPSGIRAASGELAAELSGLTWQGPARVMAAEARLVGKFLDAVCDTIDAQPGFRTGVPGLVGPCRLEVRKGDTLYAVPEDVAAAKVAWEDLPEDVFWELVPASRLDEDERLGAGLHFAARGHFGYALTYLSTGERTPKQQQIHSEVLAHREDRRVIDFFDFEPDRQDQNNRWLPLGGDWDMTGGAMAASGEQSRAVLTGRLYSMANFGLRASLDLGTERGEMRFVLDGGAMGVLAAHIRHDRTSLSFERPGREREKVDGEAPALKHPIVFAVQKGQAELRSGGKVLCRYRVPDAAQLLCRLRIEFDAMSGSVDDLSLEEGM